MAFINKIPIFVESESETNSSEVMSHPIEKGVDATDHVKRNAKSISINGTISNEYRDKLRALHDNGSIVSYTGNSVLKSCNISELNFDYEKGLCSYSMSLQELSIVETSFTLVDRPKSSINTWKAASAIQVTNVVNTAPAVTTAQTQISSNTSTNVYHVVKKGDTYWGVSRKYGTTVETLRNLNPWPDTKIPIGAKMRVK